MIVDPKIRPGIKSEGTVASSRGRWVDGNLVRWKSGTLRPVGGWVRARESTMQGKPRAAFAWRTNTLARLAAVGTHSKLYVVTPSSIFDITPPGLAEGREDSFLSAGYGINYYDQGTYGTPRAEGISMELTTWSFSNFGEWLLAVNNTDGRLFQWLTNPAQTATVVSNAPTGNTGVVVTPQRHVLLLGAGGDKRKLHWSSSESLTVWTPGATNSAGFLTLPSTEPIVAGHLYRTGVLVFAESSLYFLDYVGYPMIYGLSSVSGSISIASPHVVASVGNAVVWMGMDKFFMFDGSVHEIPCEVRDFVFGKLNRLQSAKAFAMHNAKFSEVWWFFPTADSTENDRYVVWNYAENVWYTGYVSRAAGWYSESWSRPYLVSKEGVVFAHENGWTADGQALGPQRYVVSSPILMGEGEQQYLVQGVVLDRDPTSAVGVVLEARGWPETEEILHSSGLLAASPFIDCRVQSRAVAIRVVSISDSEWEMGDVKFDVIPTGRRRK